jgi:hypothetical protein
LIDYVLVRATRARLSDVQEALSRLPRVREIHPLFGEWDLILKVGSEPALSRADTLFAVSAIAGVVETKWLGVSRPPTDARVVSDLSNMPMRSDAL